MPWGSEGFSEGIFAMTARGQKLALQRKKPLGRSENVLDVPEGYRLTVFGSLPETWRVVR